MDKEEKKGEKRKRESKCYSKRERERERERERTGDKDVIRVIISYRLVEDFRVKLKGVCRRSGK